MKTPLLQRCQWSVNSEVVRQLGDTFKMSSARAAWVVDMVLPVMIAALAKTASHARGTRALYAAIMSPKVDAHIYQNLPRMLDEPSAADSAVRIGCDRATSFLGCKLPPLAQIVSETTGARVEAVTGIMGVMTVLLFGLIKSDLHASQGQQHALIDLLKAQMASVHDLVAPGCWNALGCDEIEHFQQTIIERLELALTHFQQVSPHARPSRVAANRLHVIQTKQTKAARNGQSFYQFLMKRIKGSKKGTQNLVLWQFLPVVVLLSCMYGFKHLVVKSPIPITLSMVQVAPVPPQSPLSPLTPLPSLPLSPSR